MLLDKNGKVFGVISLIDTAILLFFIFAVGAGIYSFRDNHAPQTPLTVTVLAEDVSEEVSQTLTEYTGEYTDAQGKTIGTVQNAEAKQETQWVTPTAPPLDIDQAEASSRATEAPADAETEDPLATPAPVEIPVDDSFDVTLTLSCPGREEDDFYRLSNGTAIAPGDLMILTGGGERIQVTVTEVLTQSSLNN